MELVLAYLIERGGALGLMLAVALGWIVFREKQILSKGDSEKNADIEKILYVLDEMRKDHKDSSDKIEKLLPITNAIAGLEERELEALKDLGAKLSGVESSIAQLEDQTQDLWDWHSIKDAEGVPLWYVRKSLEDSINNLSGTVGGLKDSVTQVGEEFRVDIEERLQKVNDARVRELKKLLETYNKTVTDLILALEKIKVLIKSSEEE